MTRSEAIVQAERAVVNAAVNLRLTQLASGALDSPEYFRRGGPDAEVSLDESIDALLYLRAQPCDPVPSAPGKAMEGK